MTQVVQARVSEKVKEQAALVLAGLGLNISEAICALLTRIAQENSVPQGLFKPNETTLASFEEAECGDLETVTLDDIRKTFCENSEERELLATYMKDFDKIFNSPAVQNTAHMRLANSGVYEAPEVLLARYKELMKDWAVRLPMCRED